MRVGNMNKLFALFAVAAMLFASGCIGTPASPAAPQGNANAAPAPSTVYIGNNSDAHGCKGIDGYFWCQVKGKCIKIPEEKCQYDPPPGGITAVNAEACANANGTVVDGADCPYGTYAAAGIISDDASKKTCCRPVEQKTG